MLGRRMAQKTPADAKQQRNAGRGAQKCGLACVGVYYGYAEPGELEQAGAAITVDTVEALGKYLWNLN